MYRTIECLCLCMYALQKPLPRTQTERGGSVAEDLIKKSIFLQFTSPITPGTSGREPRIKSHKWFRASRPPHRTCLFWVVLGLFVVVSFPSTRLCVLVWGLCLPFTPFVRSARHDILANVYTLSTAVGFILLPSRAPLLLHFFACPSLL